MNKQHKGKWKDKGVSSSERNNIYSKNRARAKTILKQRHKKEYQKIMKALLLKAFKDVKR